MMEKKKKGSSVLCTIIDESLMPFTIKVCTYDYLVEEIVDSNKEPKFIASCASIERAMIVVLNEKTKRKHKGYSSLGGYIKSIVDLWSEISPKYKKMVENAERKRDIRSRRRKNRLSTTGKKPRSIKK